MVSQLSPACEGTYQNLFPLSTQPPSTFLALNFILITSDPLPGSLIAKLPTASPEINPGKYLAFCSSVPCLDSWFTHRLELPGGKAVGQPSVVQLRVLASGAVRCDLLRSV